MIDEKGIVKIELLTQSSNIEDSLSQLMFNAGMVTTPDDKFSLALVDDFTNFQTKVTPFIHYVLTVTGDESTVIQMDLTNLIAVLEVKNSLVFCDLLYNAVYDKSPNLMTAIGLKYGYSRSTSSGTGSSGISDKPCSTNSTNNPTDSRYIDSLVDDHWKYVENVILTATDGNEGFSINAMEFTYKSSFKHGIRHGMEMCGINVNNYGKK